MLLFGGRDGSTRPVAPVVGVNGHGIYRQTQNRNSERLTAFIKFESVNLISKTSVRLKSYRLSRWYGYGNRYNKFNRRKMHGD
jgi:hypothetical protein